MKATYTCEICGETYDSVTSARVCEEQGAPDILKFPPCGLIVGADDEDALEKGYQWVVQSTTSHEHEYIVGFGVFRGAKDRKAVLGHGWAFNTTGDSFDFVNNGATFFRFKMGFTRAFNRGQPFNNWTDWTSWPEAKVDEAFWRAVEALRAVEIEPLILRGGRAVTLAQAGIVDNS